MKYAAFDESGDLGFDFSKQGTSRYFSIAFLIMSNKRPIAKFVKEIYKSLPSVTKRILMAYYTQNMKSLSQLKGFFLNLQKKK